MAVKVNYDGRVQAAGRFVKKPANYEGYGYCLLRWFALHQSQLLLLMCVCEGKLNWIDNISCY